MSEEINPRVAQPIICNLIYLDWLHAALQNGLHKTHSREVTSCHPFDHGFKNTGKIRVLPDYDLYKFGCPTPAARTLSKNVAGNVA